MVTTIGIEEKTIITTISLPTEAMVISRVMATIDLATVSSQTHIKVEITETITMTTKVAVVPLIIETEEVLVLITEARSQISKKLTTM